MANYDINKLTKLEALKTLAERVNSDFTKKKDFDDVSGKVTQLGTDVSTLQGKVSTLEKAEGEKNVIDTVKVNDSALEVTDKTVNITVPTKTSDLNNDSDFQDEDDVNALVNAGINKFATDVSDDGVVNSYKELIDYVAKHGGEAATMAANIQENANDIDALESLVGSTAVSDQITDALGDYYTKTEINNMIATENEVIEMLNEIFDEIDE